ncbi:response regulator [Rubrivirga sp. IMCC45206]|uniref:response regulator n=1 Tax=Rubrivirga sp. IMCC45206 TaxID=3391614 RepID=UPI00398FFB33
MSIAPLRVLVVDDHPVWRQGIRQLLDSQDDITVVAEAANGEEALRYARSRDFDVMLIDMEMPVKGGVEVAKTVRAEQIPVRVLALSSYDDDAYVAGLLQNGASGFITKDKSPELIIEAVRAVGRGEGRWFVEIRSPHDIPDTLSEREKEILTLLARGVSNADIADALFVSENTVRNHLSKAFKKIGVTTAREAVVWTWRTGFATHPS